VALALLLDVTLTAVNPAIDDHSSGVFM